MENAKKILNRLYKKLNEDLAKSKKREMSARIAANWDKEHTEHCFQVGLQLAKRYVEAEITAIKQEEIEAEITAKKEKLKIKGE